MSIAERIEALLSKHQTELSDEAVALLVAAKRCAEGRPLPTQAALMTAALSVGLLRRKAARTGEAAAIEREGDGL